MTRAATVNAARAVRMEMPELEARRQVTVIGWIPGWFSLFVRLQDWS